MIHKILYIEDNLRAARVMQKILDNLHYDLTIVHTGLSGINAAKSIKPDLILADMRLSDMNGEEMVPRIRQITHCKDIPIIAVTSNTMSGDREACLDAGCTEYLAKPVMRTELLNMLTRLLNTKLQAG